MQREKTHYEQIPLHIVRKILELEAQDQMANGKPDSTKVDNFDQDAFAAGRIERLGARS